LIAGGHGTVDELCNADDELAVVGHLRTLDGAEEAMRSLRPSVLGLDAELTHNGAFCSLPALRRASPETAIVLPPARVLGPRLVRAVRLAAGSDAVATHGRADRP
jgi:DNA-binding NarL/FixJ family response regulator